MDEALTKLLVEQQNPDSIYHCEPLQFRALHARQLYGWRKTKKLVYLDLNFWIKFRDGQASHRIILSLLKELVEQEKISCILSSLLLEEMSKMTSDKRLHTAQLMDELGSRVVLNDYNIALTELNNIGRRLCGQPIFTHYYLSSIFEANPILSERFFKKYDAEDPFIQNSTYFLSLQYTVREAMTESIWQPSTSAMSLADSFNQQKFSQAVPRYQQLIVEGLQSQVNMMRQLFPKTLSWTDHFAATDHLNDFQTLAPFQYLLSSLFAAIAFDKNRRMQVNDYYDTLHSCVAIPYADFFFTEKSFKHLVTSKPVEQLPSYTAVVEADLQKITAILQDLLH